jgi:flagellar protein FliS
MSAAAAAYQRVQAQTATPERLMVMLFQKARMHLIEAKQAIENGTPLLSNDPLFKAANIVTELRATLRPEVAPELCQQLGDLYGFILDRIRVGQTHRDPQAIADAIDVFQPLVDAFGGAVAEVAKVK